MKKTKKNEKHRASINELISQHKYIEAEKKIKKSLLFNPTDIGLIHAAGRIARRLGKLDEAKSLFQRVVNLQPGNSAALNMLGLISYEENDYYSAENLYRNALNNIDAYPGCNNNYAILLRKMDRKEEAIAQYRLALKADPNHSEASHGLISVLSHQGEIDEAENLARKQLAKNPEDKRFQNMLGMLQLRQGNFSEGWVNYRARYAQNNSMKFYTLPNFIFPYWEGEDLSGKTILIQREQGFGDEIQFCRYATRLKREKNAKKVILVCREPLTKLFSTLKDVDEIITSWNDTKPNIDYWIMLMDLPLHFSSSLNPFSPLPPYLNGFTSEYEELTLSDTDAKPLKIGLVWKGSEQHQNDRYRSLPSLAALKPLWDNSSIQWFSLQKGAGEEEALEADNDQPIIALGHMLQDYAQTAAVIMQLDLVITVDTSVAHLAGALGKPCWVILPAHSVDWRWTLGQQNSLWYSDMCLFSRKPGEECDVVVNIIRDKLGEWAENNI